MESSGILYIVATPIGNLKDVSQRALDVLAGVDFIAAEDTRHSRILLHHFGIAKPLISLHQHNEDRVSANVLDRVAAGESAALISDAGTPLINDPGYPLVAAARSRGIRVSPIPGPCAFIAALSASGLPTDRVRFEGFPPRTASSRRKLLETLLGERATTVFYESSHRIVEFCEDISLVIPEDRAVCIARELTKIHETIVTTSAGSVGGLTRGTPYADKGEFVVMIAGSAEVANNDNLTQEQLHTLTVLLDECSLKTAVALTCKLAGARKEVAYQMALKLKSAQEGAS